MGGSSSKKHSSRHSYSYGTPSYSYPSTPQAPSYGSNHTEPDIMSKLHSRYSRIADDYASLDQVTAALSQAGLESSNLVVGIDFTKSNEWTGARSFNRRCLHHISDMENPYEQAISIIGRTLSAFDEDNLIPCYGFGDASTHDQEVFSFFPDERPCNGFEEALSQYREIIPHLKLAGPTSFAPIIETAIGIVEKSGGQYHVLLIIADGQVTRSVDTDPQHLSPQEHDTINAIVRASEYPLSIVLVGVGDGPWDMMRQFDDNIPARAFDNFQFVNFTEIMSRNIPPFKKEAEFALAALMEIPSQYKATLDLHLLGKKLFSLAAGEERQQGSLSLHQSEVTVLQIMVQRTRSRAASIKVEVTVLHLQRRLKSLNGTTRHAMIVDKIYSIALETTSINGLAIGIEEQESLV
ncbi:E3 ubiquitin-protein ligase rglg5 [Asimina triloba]